MDTSLRLFISYRREDTRLVAAWLHDRLQQVLPSESVFFDIDSIQPGHDFHEALQRSIASSRIVLVIIGNKWLNAADNTGHRRLDNPSDLVRTEVAMALAHDKHVVPCLVDGARMPDASDLPENIQDLARKQAFQIDSTRFTRDSDKLIALLDLNPNIREIKSIDAQSNIPPLYSQSKYFCYISASKVEQMIGQHAHRPMSQDTMAIHNSISNLVNSNVSELVNTPLRFGKPDRLLAQRSERERLVNKLYAVLSVYINDDGAIPDLCHLLSATTKELPSVVTYSGELTVSNDDDTIVQLIAQLPVGYQLSLSCSIKNFSDMFGNSGDNPVHSGNYHFFKGLVSPRFDAVLIIIGAKDKIIFGTPLFLAIETKTNVRL